MSEKISDKILLKHLAEQKHNSALIDAVFENVDVLKEKKHIDNPQVLSLMLEFFGPFKKKQDDSSDAAIMNKHPLVKNLQKNLKVTVADAAKAAKAIKSVDLTNVSDVKQKVGDLVKAVSTIAAIDKDIMSGEGDFQDVDPDSVFTPELKSAVDSLYAMAAYNLNAVKAMLDRHVAELSKAIPPAVLNGAMGKHMQQVDAQRKAADLKSISTPWPKHLANMMGAAGSGTGMGMPGAPRLRENSEE